MGEQQDNSNPARIYDQTLEAERKVTGREVAEFGKYALRFVMHPLTTISNLLNELNVSLGIQEMSPPADQRPGQNDH